MKLAISLTALCVCTTALALAADHPGIVPHDGERASYLWTSTLHVPGGGQDSSAAVVLRGQPLGAMQVVVTVDGEDRLFDAKAKPDGSLDFSAQHRAEPAAPLLRLDQIARVTAGKAAWTNGAAWTVVLSEPVPGGAIDVPLSVHVESVDASGAHLVADGDGRGSIVLGPQPDAPTPPPPPSAGFPGGGSPQGFPGDPQGGRGGRSREDEAPKEATMDVKVHVHLELDFSGGILSAARGTQVASPSSGPKESIRYDWGLTKA